MVGKAGEFLQVAKDLQGKMPRSSPARDAQRPKKDANDMQSHSQPKLLQGEWARTKCTQMANAYYSSSIRTYKEEEKKWPQSTNQQQLSLATHVIVRSSNCCTNLRTEAEPQQIVAQRLLSCLQYLVPNKSSTEDLTRPTFCFAVK